MDMIGKSIWFIGPISFDTRMIVEEERGLVVYTSQSAFDIRSSFFCSDSSWNFPIGSCKARMNEHFISSDWIELKLVK